MFKDLNEGALVHVIDATNIPIYYQGVLAEKSLPYTPQPQPGQQFNPLCQVIDMTVNVNGGKMTLKGIPCMSDITTHAGITISCAQSSLKPIVEDIHRKSYDAIKNIDKHKSSLSACEAILEQIDPSVAQSRAQEKKIAELQNQLFELKKGIPTLDDIKALFMQAQNNNSKGDLNSTNGISSNNTKKEK